ncbi:hypothetical protein AAVH_19129 [Aphelenchoides avenae]|nr:hypothetical protein AAVH_19129 [Aphelenchus avenae]
MEVVLNVDLGTCVFITLQNFKDKYAEETGGEDVQAELEALGFDVFDVVEKCFPALTAIRDPNLPGFLRRNAIDAPAQSAMLTFADGDNRVQGSSNRAAIEAPVEVLADGSDADMTETTECDVGRPPTEDQTSPPSADSVHCIAEVQDAVSEHTAARRESLRKRLSSPDVVAPPLAKPVIIELGFPGIASLPKAIPMPSPPSASVFVASVEVRSEERQEDRTAVSSVGSTTARDVRSDPAHEDSVEVASVRSTTAQEVRSDVAQEGSSEVEQELSLDPTSDNRSETAQEDRSESAQQMRSDVVQEASSGMAEDDSFETTHESGSEWAQDSRLKSTQDYSMSEPSSEPVTQETKECTEDYVFNATDRSSISAEVDDYPSPVGLPSENTSAAVALTVLSEKSGDGNALAAAQSVAMPPGFDAPSAATISGVPPDVPLTGHGFQSHLEPPVTRIQLEQRSRFICFNCPGGVYALVHQYDGAAASEYARR